MSYHSTLLEAAYRQVELSRWSMERLHSKARTTIIAGIAALSLTAVGLSGFATLLAGGASGHATPPEALFGGYAACAVGAALSGIGAVIASVVLSVVALKSCPLHQILTSGEFERAAGEESRKMPEDALGERLLRNVYASIKSFEECNEEVAPRVRQGQWLLVAGIGLVSMVSAVALVRLLVS